MAVKVLIVDDHPSFRATARLLLESEGFEVVGESADGLSGVRDALALEPDLVRSPGGGAITAVGAARLGLSTALAAPLGEDDSGDFVRACLERDGILLPTRRSPRTPTTVVLPVDGDRSMVTVDPGVRASAA